MYFLQVIPTMTVVFIYLFKGRNNLCTFEYCALVSVIVDSAYLLKEWMEVHQSLFSNWGE